MTSVLWRAGKTQSAASVSVRPTIRKATDFFLIETVIIRYVVEPETWNAVYELVGVRDEVPSHDEGEALAERRPAITAPRRILYAPLATTQHRGITPHVAHYQHAGLRRFVRGQFMKTRHQREHVDERVVVRFQHEPARRQVPAAGGRCRWPGVRARSAE